MNISNLKNRFRLWWAPKSNRDRWVIGVAGAAIVFAVWFNFIWAPLQQMRDDRMQSISQIENAHLSLARLPGDVSWTGRAAASSADPRRSITAAATTHKLAIQRIEERGNKINVTIEAAEFSALVRMLDELSTDAAIYVVEADLQRRAEPGMVSADVEFLAP